MFSICTEAQAYDRTMGRLSTTQFTYVPTYLPWVSEYVYLCARSACTLPIVAGFCGV